jgi:hypothetical protein
MTDVDYMLKIAKILAADDETQRQRKADPTDWRTQTGDDFYVVWFAKVLGNWKAMVSSDVMDGYYWEVTFNGATGEHYVDRYVKESNRAVKL